MEMGKGRQIEFGTKLEEKYQAERKVVGIWAKKEMEEKARERERGRVNSGFPQNF